MITALRQWGDEWILGEGDEWILGEGNEPLCLEHRSCGHNTTAQMTCDACGEPLHTPSCPH